MKNKIRQLNDVVTIQRPTGYIDEIGGEPYEGGYEDYLINRYADIGEPSADDMLRVVGRVEKLTHSIRVRYDSRITDKMTVKWIDDGVTHYARIRTVINENMEGLYMRLSCEEYVMGT
jgi:SPP1 family predicted phage head-tail adaptor